MTGSDGLSIAADQSHFDLGAVGPEQVYRRGVIITPDVEGVLLADFDPIPQTRRIVEARTFSVPLIVER